MTIFHMDSNTLYSLKYLHSLLFPGCRVTSSRKSDRPFPKQVHQRPRDQGSGSDKLEERVMRSLIER